MDCSLNRCPHLRPTQLTRDIGQVWCEGILASRGLIKFEGPGARLALRSLRLPLSDHVGFGSPAYVARDNNPEDIKSMVVSHVGLKAIFYSLGIDGCSDVGSADLA